MALNINEIKDIIEEKKEIKENKESIVIGKGMGRLILKREELDAAGEGYYIGSAISDPKNERNKRKCN